MRGILTGSLVHDIKNYLTVVEGHLSLLSYKFKDEPKGMKNISAATESCVDIMSLTSNLLDIGKMEEGKLELRKQRLNFIDVAELVKRIQRTNQIEEKQLKFNVNIPKEKFESDWDSDLLSRVLQNLLNNAIKYTTEGGNIIVDCKIQGKDGVISIFNSGPAINENLKKNIFEKYSRAEGKWSQYSKGMGLYFCKMVVDAHGGDIWVESDEKGNYFNIQFPAFEPSVLKSKERIRVQR